MLALSISSIIYDPTYRPERTGPTRGRESAGHHMRGVSASPHKHTFSRATRLASVVEYPRAQSQFQSNMESQMYNLTRTRPGGLLDLPQIVIDRGKCSVTNMYSEQATADQCPPFVLRPVAEPRACALQLPGPPGTIEGCSDQY